MGRVTEIFHYLNAEKIPPEYWINSYYFHFEPTVNDRKFRQEYRTYPKRQKRKRLIPIE